MTGAEKGRFITFEGGEGVGKSTQLTRLAEHLRGCGIETVTTREPGGTPKAEALRRILLSGQVAPLGTLAEAALFAAARIDHVDRLIAPALSRGAWVLCDRFVDSTRAYQGARGGVERGALTLLEKAAVGDLEPDLTVILDLAPEEGLARAAVRREAAGQRADRFEAEDGGFHEGLRRAFLDIAADEPERCCVVNAALPADEVARAIRQLVDARFLEAQAAAAQ
ncbi:dTMP kinase [Methylocystis sp. MJC1]|jgi:dTMP kinase|uniref:dTMP kinase n=1 Tax=Methylocystis sp. MJC1 TaxID=2654282 RepID=UPI0013EC0D7A|nr:dTMP kinase [Methylocystis sp. MJC1]KAF2991565.1 Thymidylate kinase [Methylocystis sp. MJC1]MBU6527196.1 dTMP kinase [Methylocystis sp. MJC1]UZX13626.1 dTMP kinase [Methylocystis sp. MJC1]